MELVTPKISATFIHAGRRVSFIKGVTLIEVGAPVLDGREHMVEPVLVDFPRDGGGPSRSRRARRRSGGAKAAA